MTGSVGVTCHAHATQMAGLTCRSPCTCTCKCTCIHIIIDTWSYAYVYISPSLSPFLPLPLSSSLPLSTTPSLLSYPAGLRDAFFETTFQQMFIESARSGRDDLLFYVMYNQSSDKDTIEVMRRESRTLPRCVHNATKVDQTKHKLSD